MEKVVFIIAASALCAVSPLAEGRYHFVNEPKTWTEAQSYCREKYSDLATVSSMEDVQILNNMTELKDKLAWIGLYDDVNSWRWSMSDGNFYQHGEADFRNWTSGEPNNEYGREKCGTMESNGLWNDVSCSSTLRPICFDVRERNASFVLIQNTMTWTEAQTYCREHHTDLASVRNTAENQKIKEISLGQRVWIGLFRDSWKWADGSISSFSFWKKGQPNNNFGLEENCAAADYWSSGIWSDWNCDSKFPFICYSEVPAGVKVFRLKLRRSSSVDLNDAAVLENLLKKLHQKLKDKGVSADVRLSWRKQADGKIFHKDEEEKDEL